MTEHSSPRVNKARLADYIGRTVRLTCKVIKIKDEGDSAVAIVEASDGGEVELKLLKETTISTTYVEVIGNVTDERTVNMLACLSLGDELDMNLVNDAVELWHDPRFSSMF